MSNPQQNNGNMNLSEANMINAQNNNNLYIPVQSPVYAVPITAQGNPMGMPNKGQVTTPMAIPVATQGQPVIVQTQQNDNNQKVIVIQEENNQKDKGCCYCRGPRQSPCGCLEPNKEYCWFLVFGAYVLMSLHYILTCLWIWRMCRNFKRNGCC